jgi:hypothetical protein
MGKILQNLTIINRLAYVTDKNYNLPNQTSMLCSSDRRNHIAGD